MRIYESGYKENRHPVIREMFEQNRGQEVALTVKLWEKGEFIDTHGCRWRSENGTGSSHGPNDQEKRCLSGHFKQVYDDGSFGWVPAANSHLANSFQERTGQIWQRVSPAQVVASTMQDEITAFNQGFAEYMREEQPDVIQMPTPTPRREYKEAI